MPQNNDSIIQIDTTQFDSSKVSTIADSVSSDSVLNDSINQLADVGDTIVIEHSNQIVEVKPISKELDIHIRKDEKIELESKSFTYTPGTNKIPEEKYIGLLKNSNDFIWMVVPLLVSLLILARIGVFRNNRIKQYFNAAISNRFVDVLYRSGDTLLSPISGLLLLNYFIVTSVLAVLILQKAEVNQIFTSPKFYWVISLTIILVVVLKVSLVSISKKVFAFDELFSKYNFQLLLYTKLLGLLLFIPVVFSLFGFDQIKTPAFWIAIGLYLILFLTRILKNLVSGFLESPGNIHYIILYICTLEFLPIALIYKFIALD